MLFTHLVSEFVHQKARHNVIVAIGNDSKLSRSRRADTWTSSPTLATAARGYKKGVTGTYELKEVEPVVFEAYLGWLSTRQLVIPMLCSNTYCFHHNLEQVNEQETSSSISLRTLYC